MNYFNESGTYETEVKKSFDKTNVGTSATGAGMTMNNGGYDCGMMDYSMQGGCMSMPVYECPQERVCHRYICHEVPHVC